MAGYWLKLYTEILEDPKYYRLSDTAKLGMIELMLVAKKVDMEGEIPSIEDVAFYTRRSVEWWEPVFQELLTIDYLVKNGSETIIRKFAERQAAVDHNERNKRYRETLHKKEFQQNSSDENVTNVGRKVLENRLRVDTEKRREEAEAAEGAEAEKSAPAPSPMIINSFQTGDPFYMRVWSKVTGMAAIPGGEIDKVLNALDGLRQQYPDENKLVAYLQRYFEDWKKRKTKDGRPYSRSNAAWIYDLAVAGEPTKDEVANLHRPRADPNCPICDGTGWMASGVSDIHDPNFGKLIQCECVK